MKNIRLIVRKRSIETLIMTVVAETANGKILQRDIDMSGNATSAVRTGATLAVDAINKLLEQEKNNA